jgi:uncharacterized protein
MDDVARLIEMAKTGDVAQVREIVRDQPQLASMRLPTGESPLMAALYRGRLEIVAALIAGGAEVDVFAAAATGRTGDLRIALQDPAAVNAYAYDGWTPLHLAAFFGHLDAARMLVEAGADVGAVSRNGLGNTPLHAATAGKHGDLALLLLTAGADGRSIDTGGYTPLQIATENGLEAVVQRLSEPKR